MQFARGIVVVGVLAAGAALVQADDRVDNPEYASWSRFKKGTSISMRSLNSTGGRMSEVITTSTLLEVAPEKVLIESVAVVKDKAMDFKADPERKAEPRTIVLPQGLPKGLTREDFLAGKPPGTIAETGAETLTVSGQKLKTTWYRYSADLGGNNKLQGKLWVSSEVPGNVVKSEVTISGGFSTTMRLELLELKKP